jgi:hypothetical protein
MRERDINAKKFHKGHYEIIAGRFRDAFTQHTENPTETGELYVWGALVDLALSFAFRLQADNEDFNPVIFMNRCSPDPEKYPLGDLWEKYIEVNIPVWTDGHAES